MNLKKSILSVCRFGIPAILLVTSGVADTIGNSNSSGPGAALDFADLFGVNSFPGDFLFSQNTMYDYTGETELAILAAPIDPTQTTSLIGVDTQLTLVTFPSDSESATITTGAASAPEPGTIALLTGVIGAFALYRVRRPANGKVQ
ncbi:MAG TPA: PEP-CTERM sorting domain-containing protein [Bryobacteraceae bacterium]|nr:PEP-CTERM sorting domain-containing protein [Bryobacteraceae bacterium]